jgi:3-phytase
MGRRGDPLGYTNATVNGNPNTWSRTSAAGTLSRRNPQEAEMVRGPVIGVVVVGMVLATTSFAAAAPLERVSARYETASNFDDDAGGNADADDPAIWVHPSKPGDSIVIGTLKNGGLTVVDLRGRELQHVATAPDGRFNNVDVTGNLAVVSDRGLDRIRVYAIDPRGARARTVLTDVTTTHPPLVFNADETEVEEQRTVYGLATWSAGGSTYVVASRRHETRLGLFKLVRTRGGVDYRPVAFQDLPASFGDWTPCAEPGERPQVEGMVVDRVDNVLYAAQEDIGVWRIPLSRHGFGRPQLVDKVRSFGQPAAYDEETEECVPTGPESPDAGRHLTADAEGLTIAYGRHDRTLYASSQGDSTFARYDIDGRFRYVGGFEVVDSAATDGVQHSDGAAVTTTPLGSEYPRGLLVVHDGENTPVTGDRADTNFKLIRR